ncbi:hypothetical protein [Chitinophaga caseinilytica]|uniref:Uncharacterized protein n=1 Tax=Chitinophaga caseinilytica TaxID=2267521 RepID=A0ABZ2Z467_9BACT
MLYVIIMNLIAFSLILWMWISNRNKIQRLEEFMETGIQASGTIIDYHVKPDSDGDWYAPIVEFTPSGGDRVLLFDTSFKREMPDLNSPILVHFQFGEPKSGVVNIAQKIKDTKGDIVSTGLIIMLFDAYLTYQGITEL